MVYWTQSHKSGSTVMMGILRRHHCQKFTSTVEQMGAESRLLPWSHGHGKAHRRLRSSTASPLL